MRRALERDAVRLLLNRWQAEFGAALEGHIREEEAARSAGREPLSIRLAGEFHTKLCALSGNDLLLRYVSELVSRCSLILAVFGRPHSAECGIAEHRAIVAALRKRDVDSAVALMDAHVGSVEQRALLPEGGPAAPSLKDVLSSYAGPLKAQGGAVSFDTAKRKLKAQAGTKARKGRPA